MKKYETIVKLVGRIKDKIKGKLFFEKATIKEDIILIIDSLIKKLTLVKSDLMKRDLLYNLSRISDGDYILTMRASGGGFFCLEKNELSIKRLDEIFGYYEVNNTIIIKRHLLIKEALQKHGLIDDDCLVEATFKTDTYFIKKERKLKNLQREGICEGTQFCELSAEQRTVLFETVLSEVKKDYLDFLKLKLKQKEVIVKNPACTITAGTAIVEKSPNLLLLFEKKYYEWNAFFWQKIAKSNSMKAAILADLREKAYYEFSKESFDNLVNEIKIYNERMSTQNPEMMELSDSRLLLKKESIKKFKECKSKKDLAKYSLAMEYFHSLKILEEIITYPLSMPDAIASFYRTSALIKDINRGIDFLEKCKKNIFFVEHIRRKLEEIELLSQKALHSLSIDYRNPEFNSDIKFFMDSGSLNIGKYHFIYLDIKDAGLKIRTVHEKKLLEYYDFGFDEHEFMKLCFYSYEDFIMLVYESQKKVKQICEKYLNKKDALYLAFGDEIFVLVPESEHTPRIINEIKKSLDVNLRIVTTYFDINRQINDIGSGRQIINAFEALRYGNKIIKDYERTTEKFNRIVLIDPHYNHKVLDEISEAAGEI
ncbi:MAG: hypothetical protein V1859_05020 [archaeon]